MSTNDSKTILQHQAVVDKGWQSSPIPVFVMFGADWCSYCVKQKPIVEELKSEYGDRVRFEILDADKETELKKAFGVRGIPAMFVLGKNLPTLEYAKGFQTKAVLKRKIEKVLAASV